MKKLTVFSKVCLGILFYIATIFLYPFICYKFYIWFVKDILSGPEITMLQFIGLRLFVIAIFPITIDTIKPEYKLDNTQYYGIGVYTVLFIFGWLVHLFI